jgi:2-oxoglutarate dehydrogenase E2 component (dihydrolipoamide succinyltransferase)
VTKKDILAYLEERPSKAEEKKAPAAKPAAAAAPAPAAPAGEGGLLPGASPIPDFTVPAYTEGEEVEIEPMSQIRKITAAHMIYSKHVSAHVTTAFEMDMSYIVKVRERAKRKFAEVNGTKLTYMPFIFKATVDALKAHPKVNAAIHGDQVVFKKNINLGMAVAMERGLIVPVIRNADRLSLVGLATTANDLAERARAKKLGPDELQGGTFTITNPGGFGTHFGTPVINQPQVAILGIGAFQKKPVVVTDQDGNDSIGIRTMAYITLTYDHRLIDGADGSYFLQDVKKALETDHWPELEPYL